MSSLVYETYAVILSTLRQGKIERKKYQEKKVNDLQSAQMTYGGRCVDLLLIKWKSSYVRNVIIHVWCRNKQNKQRIRLEFLKNMLNVVAEREARRPRNVNGQTPVLPAKNLFQKQGSSSKKWNG